MPVPTLRRARLALVVAACAMAAGCGSLDGAPGRLAQSLVPYRVPVVQGNFVSREQAAQLRPGLSRQQVRELLGTPLVASALHADRWDYVFTLDRQGEPPRAYRLTLHFRDDLLARAEGDDLPSESEFVANLDGQRKPAPVPPLQATEAQLQRFPAPAAPAASAAAPAPAPAPTRYAPLEPEPQSYPPLEPAAR